MSDEQPILYEVDDGVATITMSRPERRNAWTPALELEYFDRLFEASEDADVRVIVLTGDPAGRAFCPGVDTSNLDEIASSRTTLSRARWPHTMLTQVPKPTIAAINGACAGMGFVHALYCDVRFTQTGANFTTAFARRGLPAENGVAWALARIIGTSAAADLLLSGRKFGADEAVSLGLVKAVVEPDELMTTVLAYARDMAANCSPGALAQIKHQLWIGLEQTMEEARLLALDYLYKQRLYDDFAEGIQSYLQKRPPAFPGVSINLRDTIVKDED